MTDDGVKNIKELSSLMFLNLSQNCNLTDTTLELISGIFSDLCFCLRNTCSHLVCNYLFCAHMFIMHAISGLTGLVSLNVSNSCITNAGLQHLKTLKNLRSLSLESCKVTTDDIKKLQSTYLPNLVSFRPV